ncbi:MAG: transposase [Proteobacteria bacterium]|nr:transposase [Pseudomonadota bacterium]
MNTNVIYVGIDVDDVQYHGSALDRRTGEVLSFHCRPTLKGLVGQLENLQKHFGGAELKLCYEASYVGFSLQRDLHNKGYDCVVVAPSSIPRRGGKSVKTDRIDAAELAEFYANGLLTIVKVPDAEVEQDRDLLRSRQQLMQQLRIAAPAHSVAAAPQWLALQSGDRAQDPLADPSLRLAEQNG